MLVSNPSSLFEYTLKVGWNWFIIELSIINFVWIYAIPKTYHHWCISIIDHHVGLKFIESFREEKLDWLGSLLLHRLFQKWYFWFITLFIQDENEANEVFITLLDIVRTSKFNDFFLFFIYALSFQPLCYCLGGSFALIWDWWIFTFSTE